MACFGFCLRGNASPTHNHLTEIDEEISTIENARVYHYKELQAATEDFCPVNKIGKGGFGSVYKGRLKDGKLAAIKVLSVESKQGVREFLTEIKVISSIEHENLVKLYGCCAEGDHRILVYGYLENNSLAQTLLGGAHSSLQFSWKTRTKICIGVARGLAFLHEEVQPYIVHRDIKASNILLDRDLTPKISDFGLAKLIPADMTHVSTRVAGTLGYLAPEYAIRGQLTRKADVYSFGILLLEIVSGRCNTNKRLPIEQQYLLERAWKLYKKGELIELVDTSLGDDFNVDEACRFLKVSLLCTQVMPKSRPSMSTVVRLLIGEVEVDDEEISEPGMLSDLLSLRSNKNTSSDSLSAGSGKQVDSSSSMNTTTTHGTMTFTSINDRKS
ncbi:cold-responsive protein kinase 1 [Nicotiana tabacum]|uniref:Serine/threonine-protein kinase n=4 Tax=Nicotiana TaxID=4085 RepID=A0A1S4BHX5_TOBAC|nr:PREDICTED: putative serine/threonine-protein kinase [Nicotiana sylvestris]XP_009766562.1 PREDICTED: putative serine/threonine-protein kinase [Nicotiana sylvestris]XP_009766563.1 PREDICTED: putative serine/threonine-protein kinase [Nicotiana sylvestris]XP_009766564.1 PREDICTED: putative serine/threonine-protein kinase [Nicotiana sylvestris]XP_016488475.1 PREDICTED: putative serine/threonine-protein kinase [Nicotiana tabacum]XP_016488476.1 PREDICTED: putative serine/threonine-protein kinase [